MKILIVEDDFASRFLLQELLKGYGPTHIAVNGLEAYNVFREAVTKGSLYDLVCLDIMMPEMDGQTTLKLMREFENEAGIEYSAGAKILMTTALGDVKSVMGAFFELCDGYLVKPFTREQLDAEILKVGLR